VQNPSLCRLAYVAVPVRAGVFATLLEYPGSPVKALAWVPAAMT
jgi:hypothetical protein